MVFRHFPYVQHAEIASTEVTFLINRLRWDSNLGLIVGKRTFKNSHLKRIIFVLTNKEIVVFQIQIVFMTNLK